MSNIKAFVAHSFLDCDAEVIGKFLKYFEGLSKALPEFFWEHAEAAEPKDLAEKVLRIIADKNVFIGICTKKELALTFQNPSRVPFLNSFIFLRKSDLQWKTSDWIIQEIGMARALGLTIVLLIENGVRKPRGAAGRRRVYLV